MGALAALNHLLNFAAPALMVAALVSLSGRFTKGKSAAAPAYRALFAINFATACLVLLAGLFVFGRDGKMASYAAMTLACATSQWLMMRGWRT